MCRIEKLFPLKTMDNFTVCESLLIGVSKNFNLSSILKQILLDEVTQKEFEMMVKELVEESDLTNNPLSDLIKRDALCFVNWILKCSHKQNKNGGMKR